MERSVAELTSQLVALGVWRGAGLVVHTSFRAVGPVAGGTARSRDIVQIAVERLARDPLLFLHPPDEGCAECDLARNSVTEPRAGAAPTGRDRGPGTVN